MQEYSLNCHVCGSLVRSACSQKISANTEDEREQVFSMAKRPSLKAYLCIYNCGEHRKHRSTLLDCVTLNFEMKVTLEKVYSPQSKVLKSAAKVLKAHFSQRFLATAIKDAKIVACVKNRFEEVHAAAMIKTNTWGGPVVISALGAQENSLG